MDSVIFVLRSCEIKFQLSRKLFQKIPVNKEAIYNDLFNHHIYFVQSTVRKEIFEAFLKYWEDETFPQITSDNIMEYYQLNIEFGFFEDYFSSEKVREPVYNLSYLINAEKNERSCIIEIEKKISLHLDDYLNEYSKDLFQIPITSLYNIFYHPERNLENQDMAYQLIVKSAENQNQHLFILLGSLDADKFKQNETKHDSLLNKKEHFGFGTKNSENYITDIECENKNLNNQLKKSKQQISDLNDQLTNSKQQIFDLNNQLANSKQQIFDLNNQLTNEIQQKKQNLNNLQIKMNKVKEIALKLLMKYQFYFYLISTKIFIIFSTFF